MIDKNPKVSGVIYEINNDAKLAYFKAEDGDVHVIAPFTNFASDTEFKDVKVGQTVKATVVRNPTKILNVEVA